jgi:hypothetical protein
MDMADTVLTVFEEGYNILLMLSNQMLGPSEIDLESTVELYLHD